MNQNLKWYIYAGDVAQLVAQLPSMLGALIQSLATCKLDTVAHACVGLELLWLKHDGLASSPACPGILPFVSLLKIKVKDHLL